MGCHSTCDCNIHIVTSLALRAPAPFWSSWTCTWFKDLSRSPSYLDTLWRFWFYCMKAFAMNVECIGYIWDEMYLSHQPVYALYRNVPEMLQWYHACALQLGNLDLKSGIDTFCFVLKSCRTKLCLSGVHGRKTRNIHNYLFYRKHTVILTLK